MAIERLNIGELGALDIKTLVRNSGITLEGLRGREFENISLRSTKILNQLTISNRVTLPKKDIMIRSYLSNLDTNDIDKAYGETLERHLLLHYRYYKKELPEYSSRMGDDKYLESIVSTFTVDFNSTLVVAKSIGMNSSTGLDLARLSHRQKPNDILSLKNKFPELNQYIIFHALKNNPLNPEGLLNNIKITTAQLVEKFPEFERESISYIAIHNPVSSEKTLNWVRNTLPRLEEKFPDLGRALICRYLVRHNRKAEQYLLDMSLAIKKLEHDFPGVNKWLIKYAAKNLHNNPAEFIQGVISQTAKLKEQYPQYKKRDVLRAVVSYPSKPLEYLESLENHS